MKRVQEAQPRTVKVEVPSPLPATLNPRQTVVVVVDMLNDFIHEKGSLFLGDAQKAARVTSHVGTLLERARKQRLKVIYVRDSHKKSDPEFKIWPPHAVRGSWGAEIVDPLKPRRQDAVIPKHTYDPFHGTNLERALRRLKGWRNVVVTGVLSNICILHAVAGFALRGFRVYVPEDCIAALSDAEHAFALAQFRSVYRATITSSDLLCFA